jgi:hypothetical protein
LVAAASLSSVALSAPTSVMLPFAPLAPKAITVDALLEDLLLCIAETFLPLTRMTVGGLLDALVAHALDLTSEVVDEIAALMKVQCA